MDAWGRDKDAIVRFAGFPSPRLETVCSLFMKRKELTTKELWKISETV